jgi:choline dehydrogenase-like flavoprotein
MRRKVRTSLSAGERVNTVVQCAVNGAAMAIDADVIVVGPGVGGEFIAGRLAEAGLDVVGIKSAPIGGECPYWGCVPSKMIIRAANTLAETRRAGQLAGPRHRSAGLAGCHPAGPGGGHRRLGRHGCR